MCEQITIYGHQIWYASQDNWWLLTGSSNKYAVQLFTNLKKWYNMEEHRKTLTWTKGLFRIVYNVLEQQTYFNQYSSNFCMCTTFY